MSKSFSIMPSVDYSLISAAIEFYKGLGYEYGEVPWEVSLKHTQSTCPDLSKILLTQPRVRSCDVELYDKALVGSAEQSFLQLWSDLKLPLEGKFVACTPCFRLNEPNTPYHFRQFMKVEIGMLMDAEDDYGKQMGVMANHARSFFANHTAHEVEQVPTEDGYDLEINGVEVGSYGARYLSRHHTWVYGTGLAEPRFSMVR